MGVAGDLTSRTRFKRWKPLALAVRSNPENDKLPSPNINLGIEAGTDPEDALVTVKMSLLAGDKDTIEYEVDLVGLWEYKGDEPNSDELEDFVKGHALPRISAAVNVELTALAARVGRPHPNVPDEFQLADSSSLVSDE